MHGFALVLLSAALAADPVQWPKDVYEISERHFAMPLNHHSEGRGREKRIRLFVSTDMGKSWTHLKDVQPSDEKVQFSAPRDGMYWFALQIELKDRTLLTSPMKVYVNSEGKALKTRKSYEDLEREVEELKKTVERLQKKIKELEDDRKPK